MLIVLFKLGTWSKSTSIPYRPQQDMTLGCGGSEQIVFLYYADWHLSR
jgi:hypothetical protein